MVNSVCPFGPEYQPWWNVRYDLMSRFDQAQVDRVGLYSMVAERFGLDMAARIPGRNVLDICSGVGAMSIWLALTGHRVTGVEIDPERVRMAHHNAVVYGAADRIRFMEGDVTTLVPEGLLPPDLDAVFMDPPWGSGPGQYQLRDKTRLADLALGNTDLRPLLGSLPAAEVALRLPPNFDVGIFAPVTGEKLAYVNPRGFLHWYYVRLRMEDFVSLADDSGLPHDRPEARQGFRPVLVPPTAYRIPQPQP